MEIRILLMITWISLTGNLSFAQVGRDAFEEVVDMMNCRSVEYSLQQSTTPGVTEYFKNRCDCSLIPDFLTIRSSIPASETRTIDLSYEIERIKVNEFNPSLVPDEVIRLLTVDVFTNQIKYNRLYEFAARRKDDTSFISFKSELRDDLISFLNSEEIYANQEIQESHEIVEPGTGPELTSDISEPNLSNRKNEEKRFAGFTYEIDLLSILISTILTLILLMVIYRLGISNDFRNECILNDFRKKFRDDLKKGIKEEVRRQMLNEKYSLKADRPRNKNVESNEENEVTRLRTELIALKESLEKQDRFSGHEKSQVEKTRVNEIFYLSTPNSDGSFNESSASPSYKEGASIYKFIRAGNNRAEFQIDEREPSVKLALQYPDKNIDPVCEAVNAFNLKAKRIATEVSGIVELSGMKWILKQKARIRYES